MSLIDPTEVDALGATAAGSSHRQIGRWTICWRQPMVAVITVHGEIDASNAGDLFDYTRERIVSSRALILDLSLVKFFGTAGFTALHRINVTCAQAAIPWVLVRGAAELTRLLRIGDPQAALPVADTVDAAVLTMRPQLR
jgi:anti-anti-sigma factor